MRCVRPSLAVGNCARMMLRQRQGSDASQEGGHTGGTDVAKLLWKVGEVVLCHRVGVGTLDLLDTTIVNRCFNSQPISPLRACLSLQKKLKQKL